MAHRRAKPSDVWKKGFGYRGADQAALRKHDAGALIEDGTRVSVDL
ncbi:MAG TPA: hypothetical protein VNA29_08055 [Sphingomicrobium sp.]|nr:hypothetical protein [Sphingomicrobium sp.]